MNYRQAEEKDIPTIVHLLDDCRPYVLPHHDYLYWMLCDYFQSTCFVCEESDKFIGFISGVPSIDQSTVFIWQVCVHPESRKRGVALNLIKLLFDSSLKLGFNNLQLSITAENSISKKMFDRFSDMHSLKMEFLNQSTISGKTENIYKISRIKI
jgi:L-2,4-diaminobutyric acid acetyltransferase